MRINRPVSRATVTTCALTMFVSILFVVGCSSKEIAVSPSVQQGERSNEEAKPLAKERSVSDLMLICQLVIDMDDLQGFYHEAELPERKPLKVLKNEYVRSELKLEKFGQPAVYVLSSELSDDTPYFEFSKIEIGEERATVEFRYAIEGIRGTASLVKDYSVWKVESHRIVEV